MHIRFEFDPTPEGIKRFFDEEFKELVEALSLLYLTGTEIESVDLQNRRIRLKTIQPVAEIPVETKSETEHNTKACVSCAHYIPGPVESKPGYCNKHKYATMAEDTCRLWEKG